MSEQEFNAEPVNPEFVERLKNMSTVEEETRVRALRTGHRIDRRIVHRADGDGHGIGIGQRAAGSRVALVRGEDGEGVRAVVVACWRVDHAGQSRIDIGHRSGEHHRSIRCAVTRAEG